MPQVTVYIREDDMEAWKDVQKKSELVHWALEQHQKKREQVAPDGGKVISIPFISKKKPPAPAPLQVNPKSHGPVTTKIDDSTARPVLYKSITKGEYPKKLPPEQVPHTPEQEDQLDSYFPKKPEPTVIPADDLP